MTITEFLKAYDVCSDDLLNAADFLKRLLDTDGIYSCYGFDVQGIENVMNMLVNMAYSGVIE